MLVGKMVLWDLHQTLGVEVEFMPGAYRVSLIWKVDPTPLLLATGNFADRSDSLLDDLDHAGTVLELQINWAFSILVGRGLRNSAYWTKAAQALVDQAGKLIKVIGREAM